MKIGRAITVIPSGVMTKKLKGKVKKELTMKPVKIVLFLIFIVSFSEKSFATPAHEKLMQIAYSLHTLSEEIMKDSNFIRTLPPEKQMFYATVKGRVDFAVSCFEGIAVVYHIYDLSSGCKFNIAHLVSEFAITSKKKTEYLLRQFNSFAEIARDFELEDLHQSLQQTIVETEKGYNTLQNLTIFMDKD